eukprot:COSAG02_NODE_2113_length_9800_cov_53.566643_2_plen_75_part_00
MLLLYGLLFRISVNLLLFNTGFPERITFVCALVPNQSADNSSFRLYGHHDTSPDASRAQTEDGRKKFVQSPIFR